MDEWLNDDTMHTRANTGEHWQVYNTGPSISRSKNKLVQFLATVLRDIQGHASSYHFPLTEDNKVTGQRLMALLESQDGEEECVEGLHEFYFSLCGMVTEDLCQK